MEYYVSTKGFLTGDGSRRVPFCRIIQAAEIALPGDKVIVAPGIYRECVNPKHGGTFDWDRIVYCSEVPGAAVISSAEETGEWTHVKDNIWMIRVPGGLFSGYNPYTIEVYGDWYRGLGGVNHVGQVYCNGQALYEEDSLDRLYSDEPLEWAWDREYSRQHKWYTAQDGDSTVIYARFPNGAPAENLVEINVRCRVFFPEQTHTNYVTVSEFVLKQAATQRAPPTVFQDELIGPHWSVGWVIEDCEVSDSRCSGVNLGKCWHPSDNRRIKDRIKSGTQLEQDLVHHVQHTEWSKEIVGFHIVRRNKIFSYGQAGVVGYLGGIFSLIEGNEIHYINIYGEFSSSKLGGIKLHGAIDTMTYHDCTHHCHRGIWPDWQTQGARVSCNPFHDNHGEEDTRISEDPYTEVSHGPALVDNNLFPSRFVLRERSQGLAFVHNIIAGPIDIGSSEGRFTPYHFPHGTDIIGCTTINNGDDRFYNNIFIQLDLPEEKRQVRSPEVARLVGMNPQVNIEVGLHVYDDYPLYDEHYYQFMDEGTSETSWGRCYDYNSHLPMCVSGDAYFNGVKPYAKERLNYVDKENRVYFELVKKEGAYYFRTNLHDHLSQMETEFVSVSILGDASETEQPYENPDDSPLRIEEDFLGARRGQHPTPGPFEYIGEG